MKIIHVGHVMKETDDKIVVFGESNYRFDIPKSMIIAAGRNVIVDIDFPEIYKYQVDKNAPLPTGEPVDKINKEAYPEYYHGPKEYQDKSKLIYPKDRE
jgi:hypothetical protein